MSASEKTSDFNTGAVRSADANHLDFTSLPLVGLIGVARTASEGGTKYGRYNYMQGMPVHDTLNHSIRHILMYLLGDRSEPHLEHSAWGLLASIQQEALDPSVSKAHLLGPGATITPEVQAYLDANADDLAARRKTGEFASIGEWKLGDLPEIKTILGQRAMSKRGSRAIAVNAAIQKVLNRRPGLSAQELFDNIRTEAAAAHDNAQGQAVAEDEEPHDDDTKAVARVYESVDYRGERFRVPDKERPSSGRIVRGRIECNNYTVKPGSREFEEVLVLDIPERSYALLSSALCNKQVLVVEKKDWDAGQPYSIDSDWGYATASAKSGRILGEVTRTEEVTISTFDADPLPDEDYVNFIDDCVRVYYKKTPESRNRHYSK